MTTATHPTALTAEPYGGMAYLRKFSIDEYHEMIRAGILTEDNPVELLEGYLVLKMPRSHAHDFALRSLERRLHKLVPDEYTVSSQCAATYDDSEPEPDFTIARGPDTTYRTRHPGPSDTAVVIEVSASSLGRDRTEKARIYARAVIPVYWVVNVVDRVVEVHTEPSGPGDAPAYAQRAEYPVGSSVPVVLDGTTVGTVAVADVMV
jgi:hypothetical protein